MKELLKNGHRVKMFRDRVIYSVLGMFFYFQMKYQLINQINHK